MHKLTLCCLSLIGALAPAALPGTAFAAEANAIVIARQVSTTAMDPGFLLVRRGPRPSDRPRTEAPWVAPESAGAPAAWL